MECVGLARRVGVEALQATFIVGVFGFLTAVFALRQSYLTRLRSFEMFYVQRYWLLMDEMRDIGPELDDASRDRARASVAEAYLALCEDELDLRARGWITRQTFNIWAEGMRVQLGVEPFRSAYDFVVSEAKAGNARPTHSSGRRRRWRPAFGPGAARCEGPRSGTPHRTWR